MAARLAGPEFVHKTTGYPSATMRSGPVGLRLRAVVPATQPMTGILRGSLRLHHCMPSEAHSPSLAVRPLPASSDAAVCTASGARASRTHDDRP